MASPARASGSGAGFLCGVEGTGVIGRKLREELRSREVGLLLEDSGTLILQSRFPTTTDGADLQFEAYVLKLESAGEAARSISDDMLALLSQAAEHVLANKVHQVPCESTALPLRFHHPCCWSDHNGYVNNLKNRHHPPLGSVIPQLFQVLPERRICVAMSEPWLSTDDIAAHLGVTKDTVYSWISDKAMPAHKVGRLWKFQASEVDGWVRNGGAAIGDEPIRPE